MSRDPYYSSKAWRALRLAALDRDRWRCQAPGCRAKATHVDHIIRRRDGGADELDNLRSLCAFHDNQVKERADGKRKHGGRLHAVGCDAKGTPRDQGHWWHAPPPGSASGNLSGLSPRTEPLPPRGVSFRPSKSDSGGRR